MAARRRLTKAQREWRPGQTRPPRSVKTLFASTVLSLEACLMFFFGLTVWGLNQNDWYAWWLFGGACVLAVLCVLACGILHRPGGYAVGWALQGLMLASFMLGAIVSSQGLIVSLALLPGIGFLACWWYALTKGEQLDVEKMERYRMEERLDQQRAEVHQADQVENASQTDSQSMPAHSEEKDS